MAFAFPGSPSGWKLGVGSALVFCAVGLGVTVGLAQCLPVDMGNPGLPFYSGLLTLLLGAWGLATALLELLLGHRPPFSIGFMAANAMISVGPGLLILAGCRVFGVCK